MVPAAAHGDGYSQTRWLSDLFLYNPSPEEVTASITFLPGGHDNNTAVGHPLPLAAGAAADLVDVVGAHLGATGSGAIRVVADRELMVTSRTYNLSLDGSTYGQGVAGKRSGVGPGGAARLNGLFENGAFRSNLGVASGHDGDMEVMIELRDGLGDLMASRVETLPPRGWTQLNRVFTLDGLGGVEGGVVVVRNPAVDGDLFPYASVVDEITGDPTFVEGGGVATEDTPAWVAAAAHSAGVGDSLWRTDLHLTNIGEHDLLARVELFQAGPAVPEPPRVNVFVERGDTRTLGDVIAQWLDADGNGAIRVAVTRGHLLVTSRTYNQADSGTYGQFIPATAEGAALATGDRAALLQLRQDGDFRTNIGVVNLAEEALVVDVEYRDEAGPVEVQSFTVDPMSWMQANGVLPAGARLAVVESSGADALYLAYASVVDNRSGDPVYVPARLLP
jgi:hypothetical protein